MKKRRWLLVAVGCVLLLGAGVSVALFMSHNRDVTTTSKAAYEAYQEGRANEQRMYKKEARLAYAKALELDPTFAMAMLALAREAKDDDQRTALLKRAVKEKDRLTELERLHIDVAVAYNERRFDDALRLVAEIHQKFPADTRSATMLAYQELSKGNTDHAIKIFEDLLTIDPNNAEAYNQIGYFYGFRGDYDKAVEAFKRYQFIATDTANPFDSLGEVQAYSGRYNEALENLSRALAIRPDFVDSVKNIAVVHEGRGEYREAIAQYERAASMVDEPKRQRDYIQRAARAAYYLGDKAEMRRLFARCRAIKIDGKYAEIDNAFLEAAMALVEGQGAEAEKMVRAVKPKLDALLAEEKLPKDWKPHFPQLNFLLAISLEEQGRADEALEYWKTNANPPRPFDNFEDRRAIYEARAKVAVALARKGDLDGAEKLIAENRKWNANWAPTREEETTVAELRREKVLAASK
jgi:tetratricopeptide (TPR) repeat protein